MRPAVVPFALLACLLVSSCGQKAHDRPPNATFDCDATSGCTGVTPIGGGGKDGGTEGGNEAGIDGGAEAGTAVDVSGTVVELTTDDFAVSVPFSTPAKVRFEGPTGLDVQGDYDGTKFTVAGVLAGSSVWATVTPSTAVALPTVQPVDTLASTSLELAVIPSTTIDQIFSLLSKAPLRQADRAQVVLRFRDTAGKPLSAVGVTHGTDEVGYDASGSWSDLVSGTGPLGLAIVANVSVGAAAALQSFQFKLGAQAGAVQLRVEPNSVTIADVTVTP